MVRVELTLDLGTDDLDVLRVQGPVALRQLRILRLTEESYFQGGLLTQEDLGRLLQVSVRTVRRDIQSLVSDGNTVHTRGYEHDIGPGLSHKSRIVDLYLQGLTYAEIMLKTRHSAGSIKRYVGAFSRLLLLLSHEEFDLLTLSRLLHQSGRLVCPKVVEAPLIIDESVPEDDKAVVQNTYIQKYLDEGIYQAMAVAPFSATGESVDYLDAFVAKCGPVVTIDSDSPDSLRSYNIGTANYRAGATAALTLSNVLSPGDTVAVFGTTDASWVSGMERARGAEDGARAAGLQVAPRIPVVWNTTTDLESITAAISDAELNIKGLLCMYSNSDRCAAAVEAVGKKGAIQIVGFDLEGDTKKYFDQGYFYGIAVQRQYYMGALGILVPYSIEALGPARTAELLQPILVDGFLVDTGIDIITSDTFEGYVAYLSSLGINP